MVRILLTPRLAVEQQGDDDTQDGEVHVCLDDRLARRCCQRAGKVYR